MKNLIFILFTFVLSSTALGSANYGGSVNKVKTALEAIHGLTAGVGAKNQSCTLCHNSTSGGPGNLNGGFGIEFHDAARRLGFAQDGGGDLPATGSNSLQTIFSDTAFAALDSDNDGDSNGTEFAANTDPADDQPASSGGSGSSDGGGCGMIAPPNGDSKFPPASMLLVLLPFFFLYRRRQA